VTEVTRQPKKKSTAAITRLRSDCIAHTGVSA
jgi:hypothetical protein